MTTDPELGIETVPEAGGGRTRIVRVLRNRQVRRVQIASAGSTLGDWAYMTAVIVWAYADGGAAAVGGYQAARYLAMAVAAPLGGALADRVSRRTFMLVADGARAVLVAGAAAVVASDGPAAAVYVLSIVAAVVGAPFRAAQAGLLPELVDTPDDLAAANAVSANVDNVMMFAGPALSGILIGFWDIEAVFWLNVATFAWSILFVLGVRGGARPTAPDDDEAPAYLADLAAGIGLIRRDAGLRTIALLSASTGLAWGALTVIMVLLATSSDVLDAGPEAVGYLSSTIGIATAVGGVLVLARIGSDRLAGDMVLSNLGWALPLLVLAAFPSPATAFVAMALIGLSEAFGAIGFETLPQRIAPADYVSRVYSAIGSAMTAAMFLGSLLAPLLVDLIGMRGALAVLGAVVLVVTLACWPRMNRLDRSLHVPAELTVLRAVPVLAELPPPALESIAHAAERVTVAAGMVVMAEGDASSRFYVIVSGRVQVTQGGAVRRTEGPGEFFGEIGLLRDVPRTATVTTLEDAEFLVVERADFLAAVSSLGDARGALDEIVVTRLAS